MGGMLRVDTTVDLSHLRIERITQSASGPFLRAHEVDRPSLIYIPPPHREPARGCFGTPESHLSFLSFGAATFVPAHVPIHIRSPGFSSRTMMVLRFSDAQMSELARHIDGRDRGVLARCIDIRERRITETIDRMALELQREAIARDTILKGLSLVLLGEMARYLADIPEQPRMGKGLLADWQMRQVMERLADKRQPPPAVEDLAAVCGLGRRHFMRAFKATTGLTVMEWVERAMFDRAIRMLEDETTPIKSISGALGYSHPSNFATAFNRRFGVSPRQWRQKYHAS